MTTFSLSYVSFLKTSSFSRSDGVENEDFRRIFSGRFKITGASKFGRITTVAVASIAGVNGKAAVVERTIIPTQKQFVDPFRQGLIILDGVGYRQTVVVRSYEVGTDKTATPQSILNLLQVDHTNHVSKGNRYIDNNNN